jgi:diacylglycerol kinase family enzyme
MLIIVNPYATTVSDRLKNLVVYALQGRYEVEAVTTEAAAHAIEIGREARHGGYDIVVAFGGDGTLNEVANGLAGTDVPVSVLPGGSTNVVARTLGIPNDVVDATEHLLSIADDFRPRRIDLGIVEGRHFVFSCGAGIDASVVERVEANPQMKSRAGPYFYVYSAVSGFYRRYLRNPVRLRVEASGGRTLEGVTALAQNSDPFTYFSRRPIHICEGIEIDDGKLAVGVLTRARQRDGATLVSRLLRGRYLNGHRAVEVLDGVTEATVSSIAEDAEGRRRPFPVQVDGDWLGEHERVRIGVLPGALTIVA